MSAALLESDPEVEALLREAPTRAKTALPRRERASESFFAFALLLSVAGLAVAAPAPVTERLGAMTIALVVLYTLAERVTFSIGAGTGSGAQLAFVPMLVLAPPALVPLLVVAALNLSRLPEYLRGRAHPDRMLLTVGDAWFAIGPALVLTLLPPGTPGAEDAWIYALCVAAQFGADAAASSAREWLASAVAPTLQLRLQALVFAVDAALTPLGVVVAVAAATEPVALLAVVPLLGLLGLLARERGRRIQHALELSDAYRGSALLMGEMLEADDAYTGGEHTKGVVALALAVGRAMDLDARGRRELEFGALLHDIGKLRTPEAIINKPGPLTDQEWAVIRRHPVDGQTMLDRIGGVLSDVGLVVRGHHERWDGGGYPDGLTGEAIPVAARIIAACDAFSAMTTDRSYRRAMPHKLAVEELRACAGTQFDPDVVEALCRVVAHETPAPLHAVLAA
jgi:HD-GYP domain-containing protein (c-di-GMP phosphodiesterase class II)